MWLAGGRLGGSLKVHRRRMLWYAWIVSVLTTIPCTVAIAMYIYRIDWLTEFQTVTGRVGARGEVVRWSVVRWEPEHVCTQTEVPYPSRYAPRNTKHEHTKQSYVVADANIDCWKQLWQNYIDWPDFLTVSIIFTSVVACLYVPHEEFAVGHIYLVCKRI